MIEMTCTLNHNKIIQQVEPGERAIDFLRNRMKLTGTKEGCGQGECGSCTILVDGVAVHACMMLAAQLDGREVLTIEGLEQNGELDEIQQAFLSHGAVQCGFCTPGMIMSVKGLLLKYDMPTEEEIRHAMEGNLCRCTGYEMIREAILNLLEKRKVNGNC